MDNNNVIEGTMVPPSQLNIAGVLRIPAVRQVVLLFGVAAAVAAGFAIVLWSQSPGYTQLYGELGGADAAEVADALTVANIDYKLDSTSGSILVPAASLHAARMQLASQGIPASAAAGMSMLSESSSFGQSQFMENARYQHALETELGRTISSLGVVREARVHLALPKQTTFIRDRKSASASVLLRLNGGAGLESDQSSAIVNLVASSVPNLAPQNVTLIDQYGRLLSSGDEETVDAQATSEFKFARKLEAIYKSRIEEMLTPLVGAGRIRAQVVADVDFTVAEETRESFDPARAVVRSEQINEESRTGSGALAGGIPGALSNQPPEAGGLDETAAESVAATESAKPLNSSKSSVRNYEVDRTISRIRPSASTINKLSVAVLIDDSPLDSEAEEAPLSDADIERYTALVREAVGFDAARGDTVVVVNAAFRNVLPAEVLDDAPPFWEKPILRDVFKQVLGAALVLALLFGIVRPMLRGVMANHAGMPPGFVGQQAGLVTAAGAPQAGGGMVNLPPPNYEEKVAAAKNITGTDPARVAQVVKQWVSTDG
jgi:flagellar M-ring protein FliF